MKRNIIYILLLLLILAAVNNTFLAKNKTVIDTYFPVNNNKTLIYNSSFGESVTKISGDGDLTITSSKADKFRYRQKLIIKEDGVYVKETYQFLNILLFIKKEETYTYNQPLLRFPLPLTAGREWKWDGEEYSKNGTDKITITGKVFHKEFVITKAGTFEAIKLESVVESSTNEKNKITEWYVEGIGLIKAKILIEGGGIMGFLRDILGYSTIEFEIKEIRNT
jgi:hypothetical protein